MKGNYKSGLLHGRYEYYYEKIIGRDSLMYVYEYVDGVKEGKETLYDEDGVTVSSVKYYINGKVEGKRVWYDESGNAYASVNYINDKRKGELVRKFSDELTKRYFFENDKLSSPIEIFKNNIKIAEIARDMLSGWYLVDDEKRPIPQKYLEEPDSIVDLLK